ncbi:M48 family metallopeptidase [Streptacidiphilus rugosus]|uniref:membrane protein n=1 Tax=Streptacidiphilus rugosus TaxID=405783 RepID=UPI00055BCE1C|nr:membrane protein [Streptacidiphilus rugosus]
MSGNTMGAGADAAVARAAAILRWRGRALAAAAVPAAVAAVLIAGRLTGRLGAAGSADAGVWDAARYAVAAVALLTLGWAAAFAAALRRARPARTPAVPLTERDAPEFYRMVRDLADRMDVPAPGAIALTPDCDSWLEDETAPGGRTPAPPTLVVGSPFLWWMRVAELRALLAPVVAGAACSLHPEISAARRFTHGLDAVLGTHPGRLGGWASIPARWLLRRSRVHAAELERAVAGWASERARQVDYGQRIAAQEQVGLAYAGWDRLLTRVALPAWRLGRCPNRLNAGVVSALTELSRRDRLAEGFESRLGERPACDLLEEPGRIDEAASFLAAELFYAGFPAEGARGLDWSEYPQEIVLRQWRNQSAALLAALGPAAETAEPLPALAAALRALREDGEALTAKVEAQRGRLPAARSGRDGVADGLQALVCRAAVDAGRAEPGLDWLDGPVLLVDGRRRGDLGAPIALAVEHGDEQPLRAWLEELGITPDHPARLR